MGKREAPRRADGEEGQRRSDPTPRARRAMIVAAADLIAERDSRRLCGASIITRAGVSPHEFQAAFASVEDCLLAAFDEGLSRLTAAIAQAVAPWASLLPKVETGLHTLLSFLEEEPGWGQVLLIELPKAGRARRRRAIAKLAHTLSDITSGSLLDPDPPPSHADAMRLTAEVLAIIAQNMRAGRPLVSLAPWLMSAVIEPELSWQHGEHRRERGPVRDRDIRRAPTLTPTAANTGRAARVLRAVSRNPEASNRQIAQATGVPNDSNISQHLRRLERQGLVRNLTRERGRGAPNAWVLTDSGEAAIGNGGQTPAQPRRAA